jgi:uncharacterized protein (DUF1330 family)
LRHPYLIGLIALLGFAALFGTRVLPRGEVSDDPPPAYFVTIFDTGSTAAIMQTSYPSLFPATFRPFGGRYILHFGASRSFDGEPPEQVVVIKFDSMRQLLAWHSSEAFKNLYDAHKIRNVRAFAVEGVSSTTAPPDASSPEG